MYTVEGLLKSQQRWGIERTATLLTALWSMFRNTKIWSQHDLPGLNPACSLLSSASTWCFPLSKTALEKIYLLLVKVWFHASFCTLFYLRFFFLKFCNCSFFHFGHHLSNVIESLHISSSWCIMARKSMWLLFISAHLYVRASMTDLPHLLLFMM